jgi:hypothetical protein
MLTDCRRQCQKTMADGTVAPGRDHSATVSEIISERAGEIKSVHPGDIVAIRGHRLTECI